MRPLIVLLGSFLFLASAGQLSAQQQPGASCHKKLSQTDILRMAGEYRLYLGTSFISDDGSNWLPLQVFLDFSGESGPFLDSMQTTYAHFFAHNGKLHLLYPFPVGPVGLAGASISADDGSQLLGSPDSPAVLGIEQYEELTTTLGCQPNEMPMIKIDGKSKPVENVNVPFVYRLFVNQMTRKDTKLAGMLFWWTPDGLVQQRAAVFERIGEADKACLEKIVLTQAERC